MALTRYRLRWSGRPGLLPVELIGGAPHRVEGSDVRQPVNGLSHKDFGGSAVLVASNDALVLG